MHRKSPARLELVIQYASPAIEHAIAAIASPQLIKKWVKAATQHHGLITMRFVNQAEGKRLNFQFRQQEKATNVLTFPYELNPLLISADIIFCLPVIQKEAKEQKKSVKNHLAHLIVHGCLHAQGLDHETEKEALKMERQEIQILQFLGFDNPYAPI